MSACPSRRARIRPATAVTEFVLLCPFLVFVFLVGLDYCRIFYVTQVIENCAYAGALYGSQVTTSTSGAQTAAQQAAVAEGACLSPPVQASQVTLSGPDANNNTTVTVTYTFHTIARFPGIPQVATISRSVIMTAAP
jgi:Flp pilus assembly protein TadG